MQDSNYTLKLLDYSNNILQLLWAPGPVQESGLKILPTAVIHTSHFSAHSASYLGFLILAQLFFPVQFSYPLSHLSVFVSEFLFLQNHSKYTEEWVLTIFSLNNSLSNSFFIGKVNTHTEENTEKYKYTEWTSLRDNHY